MDKELIEIIERCQENDRKAQELLYRRYSNVLFSICLRYSGNYENAQDVFQEGFILIFKKITQYSFSGSFEGWIKRVMVNLNLEKHRQKEIWLTEIEENMPLIDEEDNDPNDFQNVNYQDLIKYVQNLPTQYRQVFNLYVFEEYTHNEIAESLKISPGTSKSNLSRAREILRKELMKIKRRAE
ncbi:RNA polymerase subunit sigma-70 [Elizabethkingia miricola]|uniref:Sigma-70 family RNA polymerase sigma factor n=2 Tax=Elizabethkingia miricola TaxID=172045 RepID=A0ABD5B7E8_ELIMR|nr:MULTISPECIES: sigma-70 family RNA polymerase sigma factor [Elizabethkingia]MDQ8749343.1 sigma-70 family RNA polymerase sigma factor [Elizabethkingia miricola]NHQ65808.1 sigma-70 family RNA polymerase sigma factor [Elizabethkingia miricola]NHQ72122.1 sigma-70 family RNA polymerase sigma factor [Elizabethkingia miricola]NHQ76122.1 sigma-70 family RNA polymerase sigma factor [Elizabethkingia miricola]OBS11894.1 RNA polymerase subunit sigma-70 [Elizabethkingia miricola]